MTMSSESEGDEPRSNGGNGSHFEPPSHHVTPNRPFMQVAPGMMMGQTDAASGNAADNSTDGSTPNVPSVFRKSGNPTSRYGRMATMVLNALWHCQGPAISKVYAGQYFDPMTLVSQMSYTGHC